MKTGDLVLIPFPFSELSQAKLRPAVVICQTSDLFKDLVLAAVTSVLHNPLNPNEYLLIPDSANGLRVQSILRCDRIMTLKQETLHIQIGKLNEIDLQQFKVIFKNLIETKN
jgi:mRNA interferase MazF